MIRFYKVFLSIAIFSFFIVGCAGVLPRGAEVSKSPWSSYDDALKDFNRIKVNESGVGELRRLGFDPQRTPNIKVMTILDIKREFIVSPFEKLDSLPIGVRECIESPEDCYGLQVSVVKNENRRYGNAFLDVFNFERKTEQKGWEFNGIILLKNQVVVYKLAGGKPIIEADKKQTNPLGPFQSMDGLMIFNGVK